MRRLYWVGMIVISCYAFLSCRTLSEKDGIAEQKLYQEVNDLMDGYHGDRAVLEKASEKLKIIYDHNPESVLADVGFGRLLFIDGYISYDNYDKESLQKAQSCFSKAIEKDPKFFDAYLYSGYVYMYSKDFEKAKRQLRKAHEIDAGSPKTPLVFARIAIYEGKPQEAEQLALGVLEKKLKDKPVNIRASQILAEIYNSQKKYDLAEKYHKDINEMAPDSPWALINYSGVLINMGKYDEAIENTRRALTLMDFGMGHYVLSLAYYEKGRDVQTNQKDFAKAMTYYRLAVEQYPSHANAQYGLGNLCFFVGSRNKDVELLKEGEKALLRTVELEPQFQPARSLLKGLQRQLKQLERQ